MVQLHYSNCALDIFSVNLVNPVYYVGFCTATIVASLVLFQGFNTADATTTVSLLCGFIVTFLGVHVLNISMLEESGAAGVALDHSRNSLDRWRRSRRPLFGGLRVEEEEERHLEGLWEDGSEDERANIRITPRPV